MLMNEENYLAHYGILRKSGRYPWGSGETPLQRSRTFLDIVEQHRKDGLADKDIAKLYNTKEDPFTLDDLRKLKTRAGTMQKIELIRTAQRLQAKGMSPSEIGRQMDRNESSVRSLLEPGRLEKLSIVENTAKMLKKQVDEKEFIDVGSEVERDLPLGEHPYARGNISADKFKAALSMLKEEGYNVHPLSTKQVFSGEYTKQKILCKPGVTKHDVFINRDKIALITDGSDDGGRTFGKDLSFQPPLNISSKRVGVKYKEDGGADADGVIFVRPNVPDVSLGKARYAQVRIAIDGTHYLKGMAVYKDDLPKGVDLQFNTNKSRKDAPNKLDVMKEMKRDEHGEIDKQNPFGALPKLGGQIKDDKNKVTSAMNLLNEEGDWAKWSNTLSRQVLSKQKPELADAQLSKAYNDRIKEFEKLKNLTNPLIRKKLLETFGDESDSAAVHLKAAAMPSQAQKVILPSNHVKPTEIFAPTYEDGTRVALLRFPHAGTFEIPELTVNNRSREVRKMFQGKRDVPDAVVIHPKVAEHLSGADFDGDHVVVIPNNRGSIKSTRPLERLKDFDPRAEFGPYDGMRTIDGGVYNATTKKVDYGKNADGSPRSPKSNAKGNQMGIVTNLISDMTVRGASREELSQAVRHSMVVIDAEKHNLDYKASEQQHGILALKKKWQGTTDTGQARGSATLITRATAPEYVDNRKKANPPIDPKTGKRLYVDTGETTVKYTDAKGKKITKSFRSRELAEQHVRDEGLTSVKIDAKKFRTKKLAVTDDAFTLVSEGRGTQVEKVYAHHSNQLKALANEARRESANTIPIPRSPSAAKVYANEVASLRAKLDLALKNSPRERQAQRLANTIIGQRRRANPDMDSDTRKKISAAALREARLRTQANKARIGSVDSPITPREWEAIQSGAISKKMLEDILKHSEIDVIRELATPRVNPVMTNVATAKAKALLAGGATYAEVSAALGIPQSTLQSGLSNG